MVLQITYEVVGVVVQNVFLWAWIFVKRFTILFPSNQHCYDPFCPGNQCTHDKNENCRNDLFVSGINRWERHIFNIISSPH